MEKLPVTKIQKFCTHDGPGIRTTVFLKGCPLRCAWCHNPETQSAGDEFFYNPRLCIGCGACASVCPRGVHTLTESGHTLQRTSCVHCMACAEVCPSGALEKCAKPMTVDEVMAAVLQDRAFYGKIGGLTVSGGEPMAHPEGTIALLTQAKEAGISTAVETCGFFPASYLERLTKVTDLFLWDYKDTNEERHVAFTGVSNRPILENLKVLASFPVKIRLRCILVAGVNTNEEHYAGIASAAHLSGAIEGVELLPYHAYAGSKSESLGKGDNGKKEWIPTENEIKKAEKFLRAHGVKILHG